MKLNAQKQTNVTAIYGISGTVLVEHMHRVLQVNRTGIHSQKVEQIASYHASEGVMYTLCLSIICLILHI